MPNQIVLVVVLLAFVGIWSCWLWESDPPYALVQAAWLAIDSVSRA